MASFKIARGLSTKLPTARVDGAIYFCTDTHELYIDYKNSNNTIVRVGINASQLEGATLAQELKNSTSEIPSSALISSIKSTLENSIAGVSSSLSTHTANKSNPHGVTKSQVGLGNVNNTSDANKPVSTAQATAIANAKTEALNASSAVSEALSAHTSNKNNPHGVTLSQLGGQSAITGAASTVTDSNLTASRVLVSNSSGKIAASSSITTTELGYLDGVTSKIQTQLDSKASSEALLAHIADTDNPHSVTKAQIGLDNVDNTSDVDKPLSSAQRIAIADAEAKVLRANQATSNALSAHMADKNNPHSVTKDQVGLGNVENKSSATIRGELTKSNVTTALGYTPPTTDTTYNKVTTTSDGLMSKEDKIKLDYTNIAYGTCATAARTAAKVVTLTGNDNWELKVGSVIVVKFTYTNSAASPTLNVNNTGAKSIWYDTSVYTSSSSYGGYAKRHITYVFDGTYWVFAGWGYDSNSDTKVTQSFTTADGDYPVVLAYTTSTTSETANAVKKNLDFVYNPAQGELKAPTIIADEFVGKLTGNADTATSATKATQDASGNIITSTYETKGDATSKLSEAKSYADSVATTAANTVKNDLLNGAGAAYDTLKELGELIDDNKDAIAALNEIAAGKANATHTHGNITNAGAIGTAANKAVITTTNGVLTTGTVPISAGGTGATTAADARTALGAASTSVATTSAAGLMSTADKTKLDGIATGANAYTHPSTHAASMITGLATVATSGSYNDLSNKPTIPTVPSWSTTTPKAAGTAAVGSETKMARGDHVHPAQTTVSGNAGSATKLATARTINGMSFDGSAAINNYGVCDNAADEVAKIVTVGSTFSLVTGAKVTVKFNKANSIASPTLNVNGTGAKPIYKYGTTAAGTSTTVTGWVAGAVQTFTYDGTGWVMDYWYNTTYANTTLGQGYGTCSTAAATAAKVVSLSSYSLSKGGIVSVKFTYAVPANATMNIDSKGAKNIYHKGAAIKAGVINAGDIATFIYDGTQYHLIANDNNFSTMTSNLTISKSSPYLYLKNTSTARTARMASTTDNYLSLYNEATSDASNNRTALWLGPETSSLTNLLSINHVVNGTANTYRVLHTGNSNRTQLVSTATTPTVNNEINWVYE